MTRKIPTKIAYIMIVSIVCLLALLFFYFANRSVPGTITRVEFDQTITDLEPNVYFSVMIDNFYDNRFQAGLASAPIVYEAMVEGGATRLLAVFDKNNLPDKIGPIRSARPYFLDWADEYGGIFMHAGGSPQALASLSGKDHQFGNVDEISYQGIYFYRDYQKVNPHNLFTSPELINQAWDKYAEQIDFNSGWEIKFDLALDFRTQADKQIVIPYPLDSYQVTWIYDRDSNNWQRWTNNEFNQIEAKNIVVLFLETKLIDVERLSMDTIGQGSALIFRDGQKQEIIWRKSASSSPLELWAGERKAQLNQGNIWFEVLPSYLNIEYN